MQISGFVKGRLWQDMIFGEKLSPNRRGCSWSLRHCLFFTLVLGTLLLFYNTTVNERTDWNPKWLLQYNETSWWISFKRLNVVSASDTGINATKDPKETSSSTNRILSAQTTHSTNKTHQTEASEGIKQKPVPPVPGPYESPGLYLVEYPYEYHFTINEPEKCEQQKPFLVLVVPVAPHNRAHRDIVRSTWGAEGLVLGKVVSLFFLLGLQTGEGVQQLQEQLLQESRAHKDLIQSNFLDCYKNLTIKTMVMLEWLDSHCSSASYAMKIDSDMFLNVPNLINMLVNTPNRNYMSGLIERAAIVHRNPKSKWYVPVELYPYPHYPPYTLGLGYVLSLDLPKKLVEASRHVKAIFLEDVYLGLCMQYLGIPPTDPPDLGYFYVFPVEYSRCAYSKLIATTTYENTDRVRDWKDFQKQGPYC